MRQLNKHNHAETCPYCEGTGYFQLLLGGSETCDQCKGNGENHQTKS